MKIIKPNNIHIEQLSGIESISPRRAISNLIRIEDQYIQYIKTENINDGELLECNMHPLIQAAHIAYSKHLPLVLTPDVIWYCISSAIATHINLNSEELRNTFVNHEGKKEINIRRDDFVFNSLTNPWHEVIDDFTEQLRKNTKNEVADKLVANFSSTTKESRVVSEIVLMDAMQKYFEFSFSTMCGIPEIRIMGDKDDWIKLKSKASDISELIPYFNFWISSLNEILQHFIDAFDDKIDNKFWNEIYKVAGGSGGPYLSGWLIGLFPYLKDDKKNPYVSMQKTWKDSLQNKMFGGLTTKSFSYHMNQVPFKWKYHTEEIDMLFVGGLIGVLGQKDNSLVPLFAYSITESKVKDKN
jgi:hypothetical protein